ncbi:MAG TPA: L,D-transpeptidase [Mycobacteriales bacterium]|nr:L,D-transpeptidase [Mycobacteriales bacterium]
MRTARRALAAAAVVLAVAGAGAGCTFTNATVDTAPAAAAASPATPAYTWVAQALQRRVVARQTPAGRVMVRLANPTGFGEPLTLMPIARDGDWLKVLLPIRPNGTTGWVPSSAVKLMWVTYRVEVSLAKHRLVLFDTGRPVFRTRVAVGARSTPTPRGMFYLTALLRAPTPRGAYGPYAFGLSGFSPVLRHFAGGPGQLGLHGTNDPSSIGHSVTHGCIRVSNRVISMLAGRLPLGTPVIVRA